eukprot:5892528-Pleurochrysis_carterae.AAC.1
MKAHNRAHHGLRTCAWSNTQTGEGSIPFGPLRVKAGSEGWARAFETSVTGHAAKRNGVNGGRTHAQQ